MSFQAKDVFVYYFPKKKNSCSPRDHGEHQGKVFTLPFSTTWCGNSSVKATAHVLESTYTAQWSTVIILPFGKNLKECCVIISNCKSIESSSIGSLTDTSVKHFLILFNLFQPISREQFEDALKILRDEDFLIVTGRTSIRLM